MKKAKEIIFLIAVAIMFFAVAAMAEQENMVLCSLSSDHSSGFDSRLDLR